MGPPLQEVRPLPPHPSRLRRATFPPRGRFRRRRIRTGSVGSAKPGAEGKPHWPQFWNSQAPVGRKERQKVTQILRAGNFLPTRRCASPVNGVWGKRSYGHEVPVGRVPSGSLVTFWTARKSLAARRRRNSHLNHREEPRPAGRNPCETPSRTKFLSKLPF